MFQDNTDIYSLTASEFCGTQCLPLDRAVDEVWALDSGPLIESDTDWHADHILCAL